ncbi:MAG: UDP-N-acetylglucosamine 2-epimerase, partial [bacterium]|nr:UDP-N-acetylglucosamine 2-epimerase [bacterium]
PVVNGDTIIASIFPASWMLTKQEKSIHNEAGLRSMSPQSLKKENLIIPISDYLNAQWNGKWDALTLEPFPEQWDTFVASASCELHLAPLSINRDNLLKEGYAADRIHITGAAIVDSLSLKINHPPQESIFKRYPILKEGKWFRIDIHRKENLSRHRFLSIFTAIERLVKEGHYINFILMNATKVAIKQWSLSEPFQKLQKKPNFLATEVWPLYSHVLEFYHSNHFAGAITDSGGVQEDLNIIGKPCLTIRFSTDRPETIMGNMGNILIPPISADFTFNTLNYILSDNTILTKMKPKLVYKNKSSNFAKIISPYAISNTNVFRKSSDILGYSNDSENSEIDFY